MEEKQQYRLRIYRFIKRNDLDIYFLSEFDITESFRKIQFKKHPDTLKENELREFTIFTNL